MMKRLARWVALGVSDYWQMCKRVHLKDVTTEIWPGQESRMTFMFKATFSIKVGYKSRRNESGF